MTLVPSLESRFELDSHTLRIVRTVAETGSITAAAAALGFSQPAISQHLKRAEERIGMPILTRAGRGVRLTEAGRVLARHARTITTALDAAAGDPGAEGARASCRDSSGHRHHVSGSRAAGGGAGGA